MDQRTFVVLQLLVAFCVCLNAYPTQLNYNVGDQLAYNLHGTLDARGNLVSNNQRTSGSYSSLDSVLVTQVQQEDDDSYLFVMNMFNTQVNVGQGDATESFPLNRHALRQTDDDDDCDNCLGYDMYYQQKKTGEIVQIWYNTADSPYFINVKMGAINSFQTRLVGANQQLTAMESDPVGTHNTNFMGLPEQFIRINKTFTQADFQVFPDPNLHPGNVQIAALTSTTVHNDGYILTSNVNQLVNLVNAAPLGAQSASAKKNVGSNSSTPLDLNLSSYGELSISYTTNSLEGRRFHKAHKTSEELKANKNMTGDTLFGVASHMIRRASLGQMKDIHPDDIQEEASALFRKIRHAPTVSGLVPVMKRLARLLSTNPALLQKLNFEHELSVLSSAVARQNVLYVLSIVHDKQAASIIINYARNEATPLAGKAQAIMALGSMLYPTPEVAAFLYELSTTEQESDLSIRAVYSLGSVVAKFSCPKMRAQYSEKLLQLLNQAVQVGDEEQLLHVIHAVGNAGPSVVSLESFPLAIFFHTNSRIRAASAHALRKYKTHPLARMISSKFSEDSSIAVRKNMAVIANNFQGSDFPFNKSYTKELKLGGSEANADFQGELFAGTNFDCNQQYFNYEALAQASCTLTLFSWSKQALLAEAVYGRENGQALADEIKLTVWDDVIYDQPIPSVDCQQHTYDLAHTSPGFQVSYTLWVSVIPVTFSAGATLTLDLKWGWQVCDSQLLAMVELIPSAALVIDGNAEVDLLIIKAGITLSGQFSSDLIPQGYIHGSQCEVGFDVQWVSDPMEVDLYSYYAWKKCKYWIFDCHWGNHNQQTWFTWSLPAHNEVIYNQDWKIQV